MKTTTRSTFVTVLAWIFIVLAGFTTFISLLQNIMITLMFSGEEMKEGINQTQAQDVPLAFRFLFTNIRLFFFGFLVVSATTLASAIGLLLRKNWARVVLIIVMGLGIAWNILGVVMQFTVFSGFMEIPASETSVQFNLIFNIMRVFTLVMAGGLCVLFGWLIKKLSSTPIKAEFTIRGTIAEPTTEPDSGSASAPPPPVS